MWRENLFTSAIILLIAMTMVCPASAKIIYVDDNAAGANNGTSWTNAYKYLQDALADANSSEKPIELRVAQGIYKPDQGANQMSDDRDATFQLINGVTIRGGYAGLVENNPNARDIELYKTVLSGDLADNDVPVDNPHRLYEDASRADNSFRIVTATIADPGTLLEGLVIIAAYEYNPEGDDSGAGLYLGYDAHMAVRNCTFTGNAAPGILCEGSDSTILDCNFKNNTAIMLGGGMCVYGGSPHFGGAPKIIGCTFANNWALDGGGLYHRLGRLWLEDCTFTRNVACGLRCADTGFGGGLCSESSAAGSTIKNCMFIGNIASGGAVHLGDAGGPRPEPMGRSGEMLIIGSTFIGNRAWCGGAIGVTTSTLYAENCVFRGNSATYIGGAVYNSDSSTAFANCIFSGNSASLNGSCVFAVGIQVSSSRSGIRTMLPFTLTLDNCTLRGNFASAIWAIACESWDSEDFDSAIITNCILDNGGSEIHNPDGSQITIVYTNLSGGASSVYDPCDAVIWSRGNIDTDPCFFNPGYWDPNGTPEDPNDDFWINGDYHLKSQAGRWEPVSQTWVKDDVTSPCIDAGDPMSPIGYEPFPNGGRINMGAYGGTAEASKSYFGEPTCETIVAGDINGDCKIDFDDFKIMAMHWLEER